MWTFLKELSCLLGFFPRNSKFDEIATTSVLFLLKKERITLDIVAIYSLKYSMQNNISLSETNGRQVLVPAHCIRLRHT